jgi:hypothetical protein
LSSPNLADRSVVILIHIEKEDAPAPRFKT